MSSGHRGVYDKPAPPVEAKVEPGKHRISNIQQGRSGVLSFELGDGASKSLSGSGSKLVISGGRGRPPSGNALASSVARHGVARLAANVRRPRPSALIGGCSSRKALGVAAPLCGAPAQPLGARPSRPPDTVQPGAIEYSISNKEQGFETEDRIQNPEEQERAHCLFFSHFILNTDY